jgi:hypothetical protein
VYRDRGRALIVYRDGEAIIETGRRAVSVRRMEVVRGDMVIPCEHQLLGKLSN